MISKKQRKKNIKECLLKFHNSGIYKPIRLVMRCVKNCYICDGTDKECESEYLKGGLGTHLYGYQYCNRCSSIVNILKDIFEDSGGYIPRKKFNKDLINELEFFRVSTSNPELPPYNQKHSWIDIRDVSILVDDPIRNLSISISWHDKDKRPFGKLVPLSNLIFYNRDKFGYSKKKSLLKDVSSFWDRSIASSYNIAERPIILMKYLDSLNLNIDGLIKSKIIEYWRGDLV